MAGEFVALDLALAALKFNDGLIVLATQDEARGGHLRDRLARAIFAERIDIAKDVQGEDWDDHIQVLGAPSSTLDLQGPYLELAVL